MYAKKSLGQHFLRSEKAIETTVRAGNVSEGDTVLEIGPGEGVLTSALLSAGADVIAVEKDDGLFERLREMFSTEIEEGTLELLHEDILAFDESTLRTKSWKLVANIPYNITGAIIRKFLSSENQPERMVLLVQKEVAERIARDKKESILSVSVKAYGMPRYVETVKAGSFTPPPKVDSAILEITAISKDFFKYFSEKDFFELVRAGFSSKRKKLSSNIAGIVGKERVEKAFIELHLDQNVRAEELSIEEWHDLALLLLYK